MLILFPVADKNGLGTGIFSDFGTAPFFLCYDTETKKERYVDNTGCDENDGGKTAVTAVSDLGAEVLIVSGIGCAAVSRLRGFGIDTYSSSGKIISANIESFQAGKLNRKYAGDCDSSCKTSR
ncbi:MAG: hypothetical protein C0603_11040 [Denitrovibrio sp.]|nr:MAG: hypothetical protein C0603_11040 [Denitrovibrio sp.]